MIVLAFIAGNISAILCMIVGIAIYKSAKQEGTRE